MTTRAPPTPSQKASLYQPNAIRDLFRVPGLGRLLRWRWGRLVFQAILLGVALLMIYDGFTGPQTAADNTATLFAWVHYRGFIIVALLLVGNLFCFACPFTLPRTLALRMSRAGRRFPRFLRNKWIAIGSLFLIFWLYEWLDLWASPWLTAWVIVAYFIAAFVLEALFAESPFCKYVCPLGAFNFVHSRISPLQVTARDPAVCHDCEGKECVNGTAQVLGCGTELFVPTLRSNVDCVLCLDCARACPYDNVALRVRRPLEELTAERSAKGWGAILLTISLVFMGLMNAFGMVKPVHSLQSWLGELGLHWEGGQLLLLFGIGGLVLPAAATLGAAWLSGQLVRKNKRETPRTYAARYASAFVPMGFGVWLAHYGFHLAIGGLAVVPALQSFFLRHGSAILGSQANWSLSYLLPPEWIFPLQVLAVLAGFLVSLVVLSRAALRFSNEPIDAFLELLPWAALLFLITVGALAVFNLPMEMRGMMMMGT
jgi:polyferredoxin